MNYTLNCQGKLLVIAKPIVMGIVNITPDSFFADSRKTEIDAITAQIDIMLKEGATIIDIGAQSTRPESVALTDEQEWERLAAILPEIIRLFPTTIFSVDTYHSYVASNALDNGAHIINDISGGTLDTDMMKVVGKYAAPYICMHIQGTPQTMQKNPEYENASLAVMDYFIKQSQKAQLAGIKDLVLDLGFGFGKTITHNYELLSQLNTFTSYFAQPFLVGLSRKSMIYKPLNITPEQSLNGTTVLNTVALQKGAAILRVHDVKAAVEAIEIFSLLT